MMMMMIVMRMMGLPHRLLVARAENADQLLNPAIITAIVAVLRRLVAFVAAHGLVVGKSAAQRSLRTTTR